MNMEIKVGQIWKVKDSHFRTTKSDPKRIPRVVLLNKGEFIEIRYPYEWHFRTADNKYYHAKPETFYKHAEHVATIYEEVRFGNRVELADILKHQLFHVVRGKCYKDMKAKNDNEK